VAVRRNQGSWEPIQLTDQVAPGEELALLAGTVRSAAAALYAGTAAVANDGKLPPPVAKKLDVLDEAGLLVPQALDLAPEVESAVETYRATVKSL
jgi:hypothetical protein